jgi:pyruvate,water dikinase
MYKCYGLKELLPLKVMRFHKNRGYFSTRYLMKCLAYAPGFLRSDDLLKFFTPAQKQEAMQAPFYLWKKVWSEIRLLIFYRKYSFTRCHRTYYDDWLPELLSRTKELDSVNLEDAGPEKIERYFRGMDRLIKEHCEPIGFGVMIHTLGAITLLDMILEKWLGDNKQIGFLLSGLPGNRTFEANLETWRLSRGINASTQLKAVFTDHPASRIMTLMHETEEGRVFLKRIEAFIEDYDFRGAEDREISFPRWGDDPTLLIDVLKFLVQADDETTPETVEKRNMAKREAVTRDIMETLSRQRFGSIKKRLFKFLLKYSQIYSLFRENQRYEIDRVFYGERKAFVAAGKQLVRMGVLPDPDDVWFLSKEEVFDALWNRIKPDEVRAVIVPRKAEYRRYSQMTPSMFIQGEREFDPLPEEKIKSENLETSKSLTGVAASPGLATGKARVMHSIRELTRIKPGDILVTNSTDPGWSSVFLLIKGLVLETGGVLAHGTVLSREYGLPAVTSVPDATRIIKDGDTITVDGGMGSVTIAAGV